MANIKQLVENKSSLDYPALCKALVEQFGITEKVNWDSVLPAPQQQELFGGEVLRFVEKHPQLSSQKDIRPITLKKGSTSQMLFFYVCLADSTLPKKHIEQITKRFIKGADANRYIIWFFGNKEASELKLVLSAKEGRKVVLKTLPFGIEQPYYKTYDFILNEVAAKLQQLFVEPTDLWKALWKAFDISIINRRFYDEIKLAFDSLIEQIEKKSNPFKNDEDRVQFAIRLLGRIIFCWFLKRKGIIKEDAVSSSAISNYKGRNYYHELLEPLFFEVMNKPEKERVGGLPKIIAHYPFLNGGLFDANKETDFYDAETSTPNFRLQIENDWFYKFFSNTLEKYNFTVDENSSSNAEIAIDPEMLGRIFENLLAEQNPETGESARKVTGSFYTPREIVDYMVEQSIAEYLKTALGKAEEQQDLERTLFGVVSNQELKLKESKHDKAAEKLNAALDDFAHTGHLPDELKTQAQVILDALNNIKVLDPACGSGAFPIGVLQKLIALKQEITQLQNPKKQLSQAAAYKLKLDTIQKSIYGVDIQPMAVELSRLRCWLSLVVDEEIDNIKALPNLDFKFVCANTLVDVPENEYVKILSKKSLEEFTKATEQYFNPDYKRKTELKVTIKKCLNEITNVHDIAINQIITQLRKERNSAKASRLKQLEKSLQDYTKQQSVWHSYRNIFENKKVDFFNILYFFPLVKTGFDIVIGNPPYIQLQENSGRLANLYADQGYKAYERTGDIYALFYEKGMELLKPNAIQTLITSNKWMRAGYGESLRELLSKYNPIVLVDLGPGVFENATVDTNILIIKKKFNEGKTLAAAIKEKTLDNLSVFVRQAGTECNFSTKEIWTILSPIEQSIKAKIEAAGTPLKEWNINIYRGILTGYNEAFIIDGKKKEELMAADPKSAEIIRPILRGRDIKRYGYKFADLWLINAHNGVKEKGVNPIDINNYPAIKKHLDSFYSELEKRSDKGETPYNLRNCAYMEDFSKQKIIWGNLNLEASYAIASEDFFVNAPCPMIVPANKYLLAVLNSKLADYYIRRLGVTRNGGYFEYKPMFVEKLPVPIISIEEQEKFNEVVDEILLKTENNFHSLQNKIENMVSKLYNLTSEEAEFVKLQ